MAVSDQSCYDASRYWDLAFSDETLFEADFIEAVAARYLEVAQPEILEIGCGGGRQVLELARRGYSVIAFDLNEKCVDFTTKRLKKARKTAEIFVGDMASFTIGRQVDLAHCLVNTFRHLIDESSARSHLESVAGSLRKGGIYLLGFHLLPPDAAEEDCERWTINHRGTRISTTVRVLEFSRRSRIEKVRFSLKVTRGFKVQRFSSDFLLRIYRADQIRSLIQSVPQLELIDVYDFCYDLSEPLALDDRLGDTVLVLRKR